MSLTVEDLGTSRDWYVKVLGARPVRERTHPVWDVRTVLVGLGGLMIELVEVPGSRPYPTPGDSADICGTQGYVHLCFEVSDCAGVSEQIESRGGVFSWPPRHWEELDLITANLSDPDGNLIEILQDLDLDRTGPRFVCSHEAALGRGR